MSCDEVIEEYDKVHQPFTPEPKVNANMYALILLVMHHCVCLCYRRQPLPREQSSFQVCVLHTEDWLSAPS